MTIGTIMDIKEIEIWKDIVGYEGKYQISNFGRVKSLLRTRIGKGGCTLNIKETFLKSKMPSPNYFQVCLFINSERHYATVHRLVAVHFISNPKNKPQVNHKNGDKRNNHWQNLEWATASENTQHAFDNGLINPSCGITRPLAKLNEEKVKLIKQRLLKGETQLVLSKEFGVSESVISEINTGKAWWRVAI